ncbi:hypothetical protein CU097_004056 [Rhizopus azygosporus]|uniref:Uncharacterized protein n=1 Tax=Rhizopus azygosporus TaxID=86630 RepID=A0A367JYV5_RHIAZ|nr:hypothetical protein CU097_004056 [Rhizopus azygosporus]
MSLYRTSLLQTLQTVVNNQQLPLEERVRMLTSNRNILGRRDIKSSKDAAMAARNRLLTPNTGNGRSNNTAKKVSFNDRLFALIDRLYFEENQQLPDTKACKGHMLKNDGFHDGMSWSDLSSDQRTYYAMMLEQYAKDKGWNIYRCVRL